MKKFKRGKKRTLGEIIELSKLKHGDKYDYSLITDYKNNTTKYPIICHEKNKDGTEHGIFYQDFAHHIDRGHGCPKCSGNNKLTTEEFIKRASNVHNNKYDYSKTVVNGSHNKVTILCPIHGEFKQKPSDHLHGQGCPKCKGTKIWNTRGRFSVEEILERFKGVHGDKYDYSLITEYQNNLVKLPIICPIHGTFYASANNHLKGKGCPKCGKISMVQKQKLSKSEVIQRIREIHGDRYIIPDDLEYKNNHEKIPLICRQHGEFFQYPLNLWRGVGCPKCNKSKLENEVSMILNQNNITFEEQKKFEWLGNYELDFYLPTLNIAIECQGIQHFKPVALFGGETQYKQQVEWDKDKKYRCEQNGIKILYYTSKQLLNEYQDMYDLGELNTKEDILKSIF